MKFSRIGLIAFITGAFALGSPLEYQSFINGTARWLVSPSGIVLFLSDSRTLRPFVLDPSRSSDSILDVICYEGTLALSAVSGVYLVDMSTQSTDRIVFRDTAVRTGPVALDIDFLWLASRDTLWRFDRLGREWLAYPMPKEVGTVYGITSDGTDITFIASGGTDRFSITAEKWNFQPSGPFSSKGLLRIVNSPHMIDDTKLCIWNPGSSSWESLDLREELKDFVSEDTAVYFISEHHVYTYMRTSRLLRPLNTPNLDHCEALAKASDTLIIAAQGRLTKVHAVSEAMEFIILPEYLNHIDKIFTQDKYIVVLTPQVAGIYDAQSKLWMRIPRPSKSRSCRVLSWDQDGLAAHYTPRYQSTVKGTVQSLTTIKSLGYTTDSTTGLTDSTRVFELTPPNCVANLSMHSTGPGGRFADIFFDNTNILQPPSKGVYYRGTSSDILSSFRAGTVSNDQIAAPSIPLTRIEGGTLAIEGRQKLASRDRKVFRSAFGAGRVTSRAIWKMVPYNSQGTYALLDTARLQLKYDSADSARGEVIPGSLRVWIDGEAIDSTQYTFVASTGKLRFNNPGIIDPVSQIKVQYNVQPMDTADLSKVHFIPPNDFGTLRFGKAMISPCDWVSVDAGILGMTGNATEPLVHAAVPLEVRRAQNNFFLKVMPELTYDAKRGYGARSASMQSRLGNFGLEMNGLSADRQYLGIDTLRGSYGKLHDCYDGKLSWDVAQYAPLSVFAAQENAATGSELRYGFSGGLRYPQFPFLDLMLSRTELDLPDSGGNDSLFREKIKARIRLYEVSSPILDKLLHCRSIGYDIMHTEYSSQFDSVGTLPGRITYGRLNISPVNSITLSGVGLYRHNPSGRGPSSEIQPLVMLQTVDAPKGFDIQGQYGIDMNRFSDSGVCTDTVSRSLGLTLKPGLWWSPLKWFTTIAGIQQNAYYSLPGGTSVASAIAGTHGEFGSSLNRHAGIFIFPAEWVLYRNDNRWLTADTSHQFYTFNDLKFWVLGSSLWQTRWEYTNDHIGQNHTGYSLFERLWLPWLQTRFGANAMLKKTNGGDTLTAGPHIEAGFNFSQFYFIKMFTSDHTVELHWIRANGAFENKPNISYDFEIEATTLPNILVIHRETFSFTKGNLDNYIASLSLMATF